MTNRIGIDVGGTFTDVAHYNEESGVVTALKVPSTPADPSEGIQNGLAAALKETETSGESLGLFALGTTVATNSLLELKGARTALITTRGFRDLLEIARQMRPSLYDLEAPKPPVLVPRDLRFEVDERISPQGIEREIDVAGVRGIIGELRRAEVESVAVCFLHSYLDGSHEQLVKEEIARLAPEIYVTCSHDVMPEFREYERLSSTVANAFLGPRFTSYATKLQDRVRAGGVSATSYISQSNGGLISVDGIVDRPISSVLSGPSAGVVAAAAIGKQQGSDLLLTIDIGGTSADVALIENGDPAMNSIRTINSITLKVPSLEIHTVGAGGGSIARVDSGGALNVGPESSGAVPGPACYGLGGTQPTVSDANLFLGRLNPQEIVGGGFKLDSAASTRVIEELAAKLNISPEDAALGIIQVMNANMAAALKVVSVERGVDSQDAVLVAFGGAGALHAVELADSLDISEVIVPGHAGVLCATGLLLADLRQDFVTTRISSLHDHDQGSLSKLFQELEAQAREWLSDEDVPEKERRIERSVDLRYEGQNFEITVGLNEAESLEHVAEKFREAHLQRYGHADEHDPIELVNIKVTASGAIGLAADDIRDDDALVPSDGGVDNQTRSVRFHSGTFPSPIVQRPAMVPGQSLRGPLVIEQSDTTTLVPPEWSVTLNEQGHLVLRRGKAQ